ncbi:MAG TPA: UbiA family prenyltransferase [Glycomyces sp.]|nr:UbiA family prenyltransferase [Glycomyces sp.]
MAATRAMVQASHPLPAVAVTAVAAGLAAGTDLPLDLVLTITAAIFAGQLSVGWLNDFVDARRDAEVGRMDKPVATGAIAPRPVLIGFIASAVAAVALTAPSGPAATLAHVAALASAWAYDLGVKATAFSAVPFAFSFGMLPAIVSLGLPGAPLPPLWLMGGAAALGCAAHFVNVLPDFADDAATGVRGLPHRLGPLASRLGAAALVLTASALLVFGPSGTPDPLALTAVPLAAAILTAGLLLGRKARSRAAFRAVMLVALIDVALLLFTGVAVG